MLEVRRDLEFGEEPLDAQDGADLPLDVVAARESGVQTARSASIVA